MKPKAEISSALRGDGDAARNPQAKSGAGARSALEVDRTAETFGQPTCHVETQPDSTRALPSRPRPLAECLEDLSLLGQGDARTPIRDRELEATLGRADIHLDIPTSMLDCIPDQVLERDLEPQCVGEELRQVRREPAADLWPGAFSTHLDLFDDLLDEGREGNAFDAGSRSGVIESAQLEERAHEVQETARGSPAPRERVEGQPRAR